MAVTIAAPVSLLGLCCGVAKNLTPAASAAALLAGTHYIKTVYWGGLASIMTQMSSGSYSSMTKYSGSVSIGAQVAVVSVSRG